MDKKTLRIAFRKALKEHDLIVYYNRNNHFILIQGEDGSRIVSVQLICSGKVDPSIHGSQNNNEIQAIGYYKFNIPRWTEHYNFYIFGIGDETNLKFLIISDEVLRSRFLSQNRIPTGLGNKCKLTLWLMPDNSLFDCTNISAEGEWYFLSKGVGGRMIDGTEKDYSQYLNNWDGIINSIHG